MRLEPAGRALTRCPQDDGVIRTALGYLGLTVVAAMWVILHRLAPLF